MNRIHRLPIAEGDARVFVTVAETGSFTAAATLQSMSPSAVSKAVSRLESDLGVRLLARTTRSLHLTDEGRAFHERCARAFELLAEAAEEASAQTEAVTGVVRLGLPSLFGTYFVGPRLQAIAERHPGLRVELVTTMRLADLVDRGLDLLIAVGALPDSSFSARPLGTGQFVTVASKAYVARAGEPQTLDELRAHRALTYTRPDGREDPWKFRVGGGTEDVVPTSIASSDDMHHLAAMARSGAGVAQLPLFVVADDLSHGHLVRLLTDLEPEPKPAWFVHPAGRSLSRRAEALVEALVSDTTVMEGTQPRARARRA